MKKILLVEGNLREENQSFTDGGIKTHTESLKDSISFFTNKLELDVVNPSSDMNLTEVTEDLSKYDGMIWGGSSLNIYNDTVEIRRQLDFMRECQKRIILICEYLNMEKNFKTFLNWILHLRKKLEIPHKITDIIDSKDINLDKLSKMALDDPSTASNPRKLDINDMRVMYEHSIRGELFE